MSKTAQPEMDERLRALADAFDESRAMAVLRALCAETLSGRGVGTPGHDLATELVLTELRALGLEPSRQTFPVAGVFGLDSPPVFTVKGPRLPGSLEHRRDYAEHPRSAPMYAAVEGPVVRWDGTPRTGTWTSIDRVPQGDAFARLAASLHAAGGLGLLTPQTPDASGFLTKRVIGDAPVELPVIAVRSDHLAEMDGSTLRALVPLRRGAVTGTNVIVVLPGSEPALSNRPVLVTAHYDGVGADPERHFPCAGDNASGTAVLLEAARTLVAQRFGAARPIVFAALDAEEVGARGSRHHAMSLVAAGYRPDVVNLDMAGKFNGAVAADLGPETGTIRDVLDQAGRMLGIPLAAGPVASDNRQYASAGLPAVGLGLGAAHYHSPLDTPDRIEPSALRMAGRLLLVTVARLATDATRETGHQKNLGHPGSQHNAHIA
ncbi:M28 family metallopeptidase [Sphaerisporangium viridialbum]|uniref:M28 family metallopeptidase n=1 Tax=Sphaerisporangium viridialbum TaxID=46189 RepID=UPI003C706850